MVCAETSRLWAGDPGAADHDRSADACCSQAPNQITKTAAVARDRDRDADAVQRLGAGRACRERISRHVGAQVNDIQTPTAQDVGNESRREAMALAGRGADDHRACVRAARTEKWPKATHQAMHYHRRTMLVGNGYDTSRPEIADHSQSRTKEVDVHISRHRTAGERLLDHAPASVLIADEQTGYQPLGGIRIESHPSATPADGYLCLAKPLQVGTGNQPLRSGLKRWETAGTDVTVDRHVVDPEELGGLAQTVGHIASHGSAANSSLVMRLRSQQNVQSRARSAAVSLRRVRRRR